MMDLIPSMVPFLAEDWSVGATRKLGSASVHFEITAYKELASHHCDLDIFKYVGLEGGDVSDYFK